MNRTSRKKLRSFFAFCIAACLSPVASAAAEFDFLREGESLGSALQSLNERGYQVTFSSNVVTPEMRITSEPRAGDTATLLQEILEPWGLSAIRAGDNDFLIVANDPPPSLSSERKPERPREAASIETIDVTATRFGIASDAQETQTTLSAQDVRRVPHLGDDPMRVLKTLPGTTGRDLSAKMNVRGGRADEVLLLIDGAEIHNGFHFQDGDEGFLSLIDSNLVQSMNFSTGGLTAHHGDVMSGVVEIDTRRPTLEDRFRHAIGISFVSSFARTSRTFAEGRGSWIASARRSYLDLLMEQAQDGDERITPEYQDAFAAVRYEVSDRTSLALHALLGADDLVIVEGDRNAREAGEGETSHVWLTVDHEWSNDISSSTVLSWATGDRQRDNFDEREGEMLGDVSLNAETSYFDLRQDWHWLASSDDLIQWGLNASHHKASYDYYLRSVAIDLFDPTRIVARNDAVQLDTSGDKLGAYMAYRKRIGDSLSLEVGGRWDRYSYDSANSYDRVSHRVNAVYQLSARSELRAAWGIAHQPHAIDRLDVEDGETEYTAPESARHIVVGYALKMFDTMSLRIDAYRKDYRDLRPRFENELSSARLIAEGEADRVRIDADEARAQGVEITLRRDTNQQWGGWLSYVYAQAEDWHEDRWRARPWQPQHSVTLGIGRSGTTWDVNLAAFYYSGAPITPIEASLTPRGDGTSQLRIDRGVANADQLDYYLRLDLRASRKVLFERGVLTYYLEIFNLLDRKNPCCIDALNAIRQGNTATLIVDYSHGFPRLPSFGFQYEF